MVSFLVIGLHCLVCVVCVACLDLFWLFVCRGDEFSDFFFFFSSRRRHTRYIGDWSSDVCSSDLSRGLRTRGPLMISVATVRSGSRDRSLHSCQPDSGQGCRDLLRIELLIFLPAEKRSEERRVGKEGRSRWAG